MHRTVHMAIPLMLVSAAASASAQTTRPASPITTTTTATSPTWQTSPYGQTILRPFVNAPYPHASREQGFTTRAGQKIPKAGHYDDSTVGIFIPTGYAPADAVNYVVHFHGHSARVSTVLEKYQLPRQMAQNGIHAILLVPQGPKDAPDSGCGKLELDPGGFERLINEVTAFLVADGKINASKIGSVTLTAHSGGYKVAASILDHGGLTDRIHDVCLLDASYGNLDWFANWSAASPDHRLVSFYTDHLANENKELMSLLDKRGVTYRQLKETDLNSDSFSPRGVTFVPTTLPHDFVPMKTNYFGRVVRAGQK